MTLTGLNYHFRLGGNKVFYWELYVELYYDGLTKDRFFKRYRTLGATGNYLVACFWNLFLKDETGKKMDSHLYL